MGKGPLSAVSDRQPDSEDLIVRQGWLPVAAAAEGRPTVMVHQRFETKSIRACLAPPWCGGVEASATPSAPAGSYFHRHLAAGGLGLSLRTDTAVDTHAGRLFAAAVRNRLAGTEAAATALELAIRELVSNAIIHGNLGLARAGDLNETDLRHALAESGRAGRRLQLSAAVTAEAIEIAVEDDGDGYVPGALWYRAIDPMRPRGLALVSAVVSASRVENGGRTTVIAFPVRTVRAPSASLADVRVLVVDGDAASRIVLGRLLSRIGITRIEMATDGAEGLAAVARETPDMVLLEVMLSKVDGYELCRNLRQTHPRSELPVIFVTALDDPATRATCFSAGGTDMVSKPFNSAEIVARVGIHLQHRLLLARLEGYQQRVRAELRKAGASQLALAPAAAFLDGIRERLGLAVDGLMVTSSELGGDFWTLFNAGPRQVVLLIADFTGHGVAAALNVFRLHLMITRLPRQVPSPAALLDQFNTELKGLLEPGQFAAAFVGWIDLDSGTLTYAAAASPLPVMVIDGTARLLDAAGPPLGAFADSHYQERTVAMPPGATLLAYSDALIESEADGQTVCDETTLTEWVSEAKPGQSLAAEVLERFRRRLPGEPPDDLTLVSVHRLR